MGAFFVPAGNNFQDNWVSDDVTDIGSSFSHSQTMRGSVVKDIKPISNFSSLCQAAASGAFSSALDDLESFKHTHTADQQRH